MTRSVVDPNVEVIEEAEESAELSEFSTNVVHHVKAGYQALYIHTPEEQRAEDELERAVRLGHGGTLVTWDFGVGFVRYGETEKISQIPENNHNAPHMALDYILSSEARNLFPGKQYFVMRDFDDFFDDPRVRRRILNMANGRHLVQPGRYWPLIILSSQMKMHPKLKTALTVLEFDLPTESQMHQAVGSLQHDVRSAEENYLRQQGEAADQASELTPELHRTLTSNLLGLTWTEAENCLARLAVKHRGWHNDMLSTVKQEKADIIKKSEVLTYIPENTMQSRDEIGGYDAYMEWLDRRKLAYTELARDFNIDYPKGCVLVGLPGTGKSIVAQTTCMILGLPGYVLDIGSLFGSLVGESEQRTRDVLRQIDAQQGCVLVIDEADKALGNAHSSRGDSGVTRRVFGTILSWLAANKSRTFCIMTLNRTEGLPPELTRAGRFDSIFYTDYPDEEERRQIMEIHMRMRSLDPATLDLGPAEWDQVIERTEHFVGSELEEVVRESRYLALEQQGNGTPTFEQLITAVGSITPLHESDPEGMQAIRDFCQGRAKPVTTPKQKKGKKARRGRSLNLDN